MTEPAYAALSEDELQNRAERAQAVLQDCTLCGHSCEVDRTAGERGVCGAGQTARVASYGPHLGEEAPLRGTRGSGTIFFAGCSLTCIYCQNHDISQRQAGREVDTGELGDLMLRLQERGCHNINLVSPTHVVPQALAAVSSAVRGGLELPLVYNTGGYDALETLRLLDGVVDIYMPDMKYQRAEVAEELSGVPDYPEVNRTALKEMHRQVGDLQLDNAGVAVRGLLVRHLVLPEGLADTRRAMEYLATELSTETFVNVMDQYYPAYRAHQHSALNRRLKPQEFRRAVEAARDAGLHRLYGIGRL
jgi:putative pyruvate formate lyase activating enzyme